MRITEGQLRRFIRKSFLIESARESKAFIALTSSFDDPDLVEKIGKVADHKKAGSVLVKWLESRFISKTVPEIHQIEDVIVSVLGFLDSFEVVENKWKADPEFKKTVSDYFQKPEWIKANSILGIIPLMSSDEIETLMGLAKRERQNFDVNVSEEEMESDRVGKVGSWNLWMPTTRERSCKIAQYDPVTLQPKTTWCTARMAGSNLFYNYVGRHGVNIILFYIIRDQPAETEDWLSVGFINGKPELSGKSGGVSVDRENSGLNAERLQSILGEDYGKIMGLLAEKSASVGGKHPAREKIAAAASSVKDLQRLVKGLSKDEARDLKINLLNEPEIDSDIYWALAYDPDKAVQIAVAQSTRTPADVLEDLAVNGSEGAKVAVAGNTSANLETLEYLSLDHHESVKLAVSQNGYAPAAAVKNLANASNPETRAIVAIVSRDAETLMQLASDEDFSVRYRVAKNLSAPPDALVLLAQEDHQNIRRNVANNMQAPKEALTILANDPVYSVRQDALSNLRSGGNDSDISFYYHGPAEEGVKELPADLITRHIKSDPGGAHMVYNTNGNRWEKAASFLGISLSEGLIRRMIRASLRDR